MFKVGDMALLPDGRVSKVISADPNSFDVQTEDGTYAESDLQQGHPTVLATANPPENGSAIPMPEYVPRTYSLELQDKLESILQKMDIDVMGHWRSGADLYDVKHLTRYMFVSFLSDPSLGEKVQSICDAFESKKPLDTWIPVSSTSSSCSTCAKDHLTIETNGVTLRIGDSVCEFADGFPLTEWELNVPSGQLVVANDLRDWFPLPQGTESLPSVNSALGCQETALAYANVGLSHAFVGNTCPSLTRFKSRSNTRFKIGRGRGKALANICTDLWWYSICDKDELDRRAARYGEVTARFEVVKVKPGVYRFRHRDGEDNYAISVFTEIEWVRDPDPVRDFAAEYESMDVSPLAYVKSKVHRWPALYGHTESEGLYRRYSVIPWEEMTEEQKRSSWASVANTIFFTIGSGTEWHHKGFPLAAVEASEEKEEIPSFREQHGWYPFSKTYGGIYREVLSPSFARLAFRLLESVISFGTIPHDDGTSRHVEAERERMLLAVDRYRALAAKYPDEADPDYVTWLSQPGRAEGWVSRFNLGPKYFPRHKDHIAQQLWLPEDTYAIEFDANELSSEEDFVCSSGWADKESATGYAILRREPTQDIEEGQNVWLSHAKNTAVPLKFVAKVVRRGELAHTGEVLTELAFDYGSDWMKDESIRKAVNEYECKNAIRPLTKEEYESKLSSYMATTVQP